MTSSPYGIVLREGRDGADARRDPPRDRPPPARARRRAAPGPLPDDRLHHAVRQDRAALHRDRRLLRPARLRRRAPGPARPPPLRGHRGVLPQRHAAHRRGRLRHDRVDRRAAVVERAHRHGRQLVRGHHADPHGARARRRTSPRSGPTSRRRTRYHHQTREGGAMQLHMFWALYIHAADAQDMRGDPAKQEEVWDDLRNLRRAVLEVRRGARASSRCGTCRRSSETLDRLHDARRLRRVLGAGGERLHALTSTEHADIPATLTTGWYDGFPHSDTEYFAAMAEKNASPQRLIVGPWSHVGMRGDATLTLDVDFGETSRWGVRALLRRAARASSTASSRTSDGPAARRGAGADLRHGRRQRPQDGARASSTTAAAGATSRSGRSRAPCRRPSTSRGDGSLSRRSAGERRAAALHLRPRGPGADDRRQLLRRRRAAGRRARAWSRCGCGC